MTTDTLTTLDLPALDLEPLTPGDKAPNRCQEDGCTNGVPKPARGRPPKYCTDHRKGGAPTGKAEANFNPSKSSLSGKSWPRAAEVETLLTKYVQGLGVGLRFVHEKDGDVIIAGGPDVVHELVELAKDERQLRKYLEWLTSPGKYAPLTLAVAGIAIPLMSNHGLITLDLSKLVGPSKGGD